jgi:uncharacterized protein VirK/YbjX
MTFSLPSLFFLGASGFLGGALLLSGEPLWALMCGMAAVATGAWGRRRIAPEAGFSGRHISLWTAASLGQPPVGKGWRRKRAKFVLRAAWHPREMRLWVNRLMRSDARPLWEARPRIVAKPQRPYMNYRWDAAARLEALSSHYDILRELLSPAARERVYRDGITLVRLFNPGGRAVDLRLAYRDQFEKEGELSLAVADVETTLTLAGLSFCLVGGPIGRTAWIGGLQASGDPRTRGLIRDVAKEMHGLRPKALALWSLRQLCTPWQVDHLRSVSDGNHVYRHFGKRRDFEAKYDEFWAESGGLRHADGDWDLPTAVPPRAREEIKPSRRKAHELRYAMLADLRAELLAAVSTLAPEAAPEEAAGLPLVLAGC